MDRVIYEEKKTFHFQPGTQKNIRCSTMYILSYVHYTKIPLYEHHLIIPRVMKGDGGAST